MKKVKKIIVLLFLVSGCYLFFFLTNNMEQMSKKSNVKAEINSDHTVVGQTIKNNGLRLKSRRNTNLGDPNQPVPDPLEFDNYLTQQYIVKAGDKFRVRGTIQVEKSDSYVGDVDQAGWIRFGDFVWKTSSSEVGTTVFVDEEVTIKNHHSGDFAIWFQVGFGGYRPLFPNKTYAKAQEIITSFSNLSLINLTTQKEMIENAEFNVERLRFDPWMPFWDYNRITEDGWLAGSTVLRPQEEFAQGGFIEVKGGTVTYRYQDEKGNKLAEDKKIIKNINDIHKEEPIFVEGYHHTDTKGNNPITISKDSQEVTFIYAKDSEPEKGKVTIKYQDEKGNTLSSDEVIEGEINSEYNISDYELELEGYEYVRSMGDPLKGTYKNNPQTVYLIYRKMGKIIIQYLDENGESIADDVVSYGEVGESYAVKDVDIEGYRFIGDKTPITGVYKETEEIVRLNYAKIGTVTFKYQDEEGLELAKDEVYQDVVGETYPTTKLVTIVGYKYSKTLEDGNSSNYGEVTSEPKTVIYIYKENYFGLLQEVNKSDGSNANLVALNEDLIYQLKLTSNLKGSDNYYTSLTITEIIDSSLEDPTDIKLTTTDGSVIGKITYNSLNRKITASLKRSDNIYYSENITLSYKAKVKTNLDLGTVIKEKGVVKASYTDGKISNEKESNEVESKVDKGNLIFESAPDIISFGDEANISSKKRKYFIESKDGALSVKDLRGDGNVWSMTAKMMKLLTHENETTLSEGIMYPYNGNVQFMGLKSEVLIYEETTSSTETINISDVWKDNITQPFVEVNPGVARKGTYSGVIQWTLRDVPSGHKISAEGGIINE